MKRCFRTALIGFSALSVGIMLALLVPSPAVSETTGQQVFETAKCGCVQNAVAVTLKGGAVGRFAA